jgi:hypothetical protein
MNVCQLQSRSREPGFKSPLRNSTDDLPRYEQKQTNAISFPHLGQNTRQYFRFRPFLRRARLPPTVKDGSVPLGEAPPEPGDRRRSQFRAGRGAWFPPDIFHDIPWQGRFYWFLSGLFGVRVQQARLSLNHPKRRFTHAWILPKLPRVRYFQQWT